MNTIRRSIPSAMAALAPSTRNSSLNSFLLFLVGISLAGSGFRILRADFLGLRVHTYLIVVGAFLPLLSITRLHLIPSRHLFEMLAFASFYFATTIPGGVAFSEGIKMFAAVATLLTMAMLVNDWDDFVVGVMGMCLAVAILAVKGLEADVSSAAGIKAMEEANRNTYSMYALPPILLGSYVLVRGRPDALIKKLLIAGAVLASALAICLNLNRSGWLGLAVVAVLIVREKSTKAAVILTLIGISLFLLMTTVFSSSMGHLLTRWDDTRAGLESDRLRWRLFVNGLEIALENPLIGVSPQELPYVLAQKMGYHEAGVASHNVYAHVAGGCGIIGLLLLLRVGWTFWTWKPDRPVPPHLRVFFKEAQRILRLVLVLWLVRGAFTHEILYSPGFCMAIGLAFGLQLSYVGKGPVNSPRGLRSANPKGAAG